MKIFSNKKTPKQYKQTKACLTMIIFKIIHIFSSTRSATKCNKGLDVLLTACVEDTFLIVMRVCRGPQHADKTLDLIQTQLYCQICEERCFLPGGLTPVGKDKMIYIGVSC